MKNLGDLAPFLLVLVGAVGGWLFSRRRAGINAVSEIQDATRRRVNAEAIAETKAAEKEHAETVKDAEKAETQIEEAGPKELAEMVNKTFN